jgi:hypothetical protein
VNSLADSVAAVFTGTLFAFALLAGGPLLAQIPVRRQLRRLRRRVFPSSLLID